jgi:predicted acylesterase/phospholipase RssA
MLLKDVEIPLHILVDGVGDVPRVFSSTNKEDGEIELYRILDATTAIPAVFPSVEIEDKHYVDAVLIATSPKTIAYFIALAEFGTSDFCMVSIGAQLQGSLAPTLSHAVVGKQCDGILDHFRHGLVSKMIWRRDALMETLVRKSLKQRFLRLEAIINIDNASTFQSIHDHCKEQATAACRKYVSQWWEV